jgi:hypothetical protein
MEETADPGSENPANDQNQERRANGVHDSLEVTLIFSSRNERCSATDEGHLGGVGNNGICLSTLATSSVIDNISNILVNSERLSSHRRLINGQESVARTVLVAQLVIIVALVLDIFTSLFFQFALVLCVAVGVVVGRDNTSVGRNDLAIFDNDLEKSDAIN